MARPKKKKKSKLIPYKLVLIHHCVIYSHFLKQILKFFKNTFLDINYFLHEAILQKYLYWQLKGLLRGFFNLNWNYDELIFTFTSFPNNIYSYLRYSRTLTLRLHFEYYFYKRYNLNCYFYIYNLNKHYYSICKSSSLKKILTYLRRYRKQNYFYILLYTFIFGLSIKNITYFLDLFSKYFLFQKKYQIRYLKFLKTVIRVLNLERLNILGIKFSVKGRLNGKLRKNIFKAQRGFMLLNTLDSRISSYNTEVYNRFGKYRIDFLIYN